MGNLCKKRNQQLNYPSYPQQQYQQFPQQQYPQQPQQQYQQYPQYPQPQPQPNPYPNYHPVAPAPAPKPIIIYCDDCYAEPNEPKICAQYRRKPKAEDEVASD